jgi:hypothetical protein
VICLEVDFPIPILVFMNPDEKEYIKSKIDQLKLPFGLLSTLFIFSCGGYGFIMSKSLFYQDPYLVFSFFVNLLLSSSLGIAIFKIYKNIGDYIETLKP